MNSDLNKKNAEPDAGPGAPPPEAAGGEASPAAEPPGRQDGQDSDRIAQLEGEVALLKDQLLRAMAETENVRRRAERDREETARYSVSKFAKELVAVADNLHRALESVPPEARTTDEALNNLMIGIEATGRQLSAAFEKAGIHRMDSLDKPFDPNFHQVMFEVESTDKPAGTVVQVLQEGYMIHDRLLREAMVGVAKQGAGGTGHVDTTA
jgi:molecular chaperone GrpE